MMKVIEVDKFLTSLVDEKWPDEGLLFGQAERVVKGILVAWMATPEALNFAIKRKCNLIICHEELMFPYLKDMLTAEDLKALPDWAANLERLEIMQKNNLSVIRSHYRADQKFNVDELAMSIGLPKPIEQNSIARIYKMDHITVRNFVKQVKEKLKIDKVKIIGNLDFSIKKLGIAIGGMALGMNLNFMERHYIGKCDTVLAGEADEYAQFYAKESKLNLIITGHASMENIGLNAMARFLRKQFSGIPVLFFENKLPGKWI